MDTPNLFADFTMSSGKGPVYRQIAEHLTNLVETGAVSAGRQIPTQRAIATQLGVNLTTVSRAFAVLQQNGIVESSRGRGTSISPRHHAKTRRQFQTSPETAGSLLDLTVNRPATSGYLAALTEVLRDVEESPHLTTLQDYQAAEGPEWARVAAAEWMQDSVGFSDPDRVVLTNGAQHSLACTLSAIASPGDLIVTDRVTYQGINAICSLGRLDVIGVESDGYGMVPEALETVVRARRPKAIFLIPTFHNPMTITMPESRRREIVAIAERNGILIVEDGVYNKLAEGAPASIASMAPDLTIHVSSLSKCVAPGLRAGFLLAPGNLIPEVSAALRASCWSISPLMALCTAELYARGHLDALVQAQKDELRERHRIVRSCLGTRQYLSSETCTHIWLDLPHPWTTLNFCGALLRRNIRVIGGDAFTVGMGDPVNAARINISAARSREDLTRVMDIVAWLLDSRGRAYSDVI